MSIPIIYVIPKTRKGIIIFFSIVLAVSIIGAGIVLALWAKDQKTLKEIGQPSFNELNMDELENGLIVTGSIDLAFDTFAESYETNYGVRTSDDSEDLYYVIPIYDVDDEGYFTTKYFMTFNAKPRNYETMDKIMEQTWVEQVNYSELKVENGVIKVLPSDLHQYFLEWAEDTSFYENGSFFDWCAEYNILGTTDKEVIKSKVAPFMIVETATAGTSLDGLWACLIFGVISLIVIIVMKKMNKPIKGIDPPPDHGFRELKEMQEDDRKIF